MWMLSRVLDTFTRDGRQTCCRSESLTGGQTTPPVRLGDAMEAPTYAGTKMHPKKKHQTPEAYMYVYAIYSIYVAAYIHTHISIHMCICTYIYIYAYISPLDMRQDAAEVWISQMLYCSSLASAVFPGKPAAGINGTHKRATCFKEKGSYVRISSRAE